MALPEKLARLEDLLCKAANVDPIALHSTNREREYADVRHAIWYIARNYLGYSYPRLARFYGRDHTTVIHGIKRMALNPDHKRIVQRVHAKDPALLERDTEPGQPRPMDHWDL